MFDAAFSREHTIADQASARVLSDGDEHFADLFGIYDRRTLVSAGMSISTSHEALPDEPSKIRNCVLMDSCSCGSCGESPLDSG
jgi:hypothetical protein